MFLGTSTPPKLLVIKQCSIKWAETGPAAFLPGGSLVRWRQTEENEEKAQRGKLRGRRACVGRCRAAAHPCGLLHEAARASLRQLQSLTRRNARWREAEVTFRATHLLLGAPSYRGHTVHPWVIGLTWETWALCVGCLSLF